MMIVFCNFAVGCTRAQIICQRMMRHQLRQPMKPSTVIRFLIIGALWLGTCVWFVLRLKASGTPLTLVSLFPLVASAFIVFVPLYKKYVKNGQKADSNRK
jgi:hypothetical protein